MAVHHQHEELPTAQQRHLPIPKQDEEGTTITTSTATRHTEHLDIKNTERQCRNKFQLNHK
jgi:hypothetical protein